MVGFMLELLLLRESNAATPPLVPSISGPGTGDHKESLAAPARHLLALAQRTALAAAY